MTLRFDSYNRLTRWGAGVTAAGLFIFSGGIAASGADQSVVAPEDATVLWIDVEDGGLKAEELTGKIVAGDATQNLEFHASPTGLTAVLKDFPKEFALRLSASEKTSARVAMTFATAQENIVSETSSIVELPGFNDDEDNSTPDATPTPTPTPTPDESNPDDLKDEDDKPSTDAVPTESESSSSGPGTNSPDNDDAETKSSPQAGMGDRDKGSTAVTGAAVGWAAGSAAVLLVAGIGLLAVRKRGAHRNG